MKTLILLAILVIAGIAAYAYLDPGFRGELDELSGQVIQAQPKTAVVYKWRDTNGQWQITDRPPPAGTPHETLHYRSDENILPAPPGLDED